MPSQASQQMRNQAQAKLDALRQAAQQPAPQARQPQPAPQAPAPALTQEPPQPAPQPAPLLAPPPLEYQTAPAPQAQPLQPSATAPSDNGLPAPPSAPGADAMDPAKLMARIRTLEGILEKERTTEGPAREKKLRDQIAELQGKLEDATRPPPMQLRLEDHFTPEQITEEGAEALTAQLAAFDKIARARANELSEPLKRAIEQSRQQREADERAAQERREAEFWAQISEALPGWEKWATPEAIAQKAREGDTRFGDWLNVSVYGRRRQDYLSAAIESRQAQTVVDMLKEFLRSLERGAPVPPPHTRVVPEGRAPSADPPPPPAPYDIKESEVLAFQNDVQHGRYKGRPKELDAMYKRIQKAAAEGRIGPG